MVEDIRRRNVLSGIGALVTVGALAGCSTETQNGGGDGGDGGDETMDGEDGGGGDGGAEVPSAVDDYLSDANNYDGSIADETGSDSPTVMVGAGDGGLAFGPAAVRVSQGTTVTWEWTGAGGSHNVVDEDGAFESELYGDEGETFEHTFEESGTYMYVCQPHQTQGMLGAVVVE